MFCKYCGGFIDGDSVFCKLCGEDLSSANVTDNTNQSDNEISEVYDMFGGNKLEAIKHLHVTTGVNLAEAKKMIDAEHQLRKQANEKKGFWATVNEDANKINAQKAQEKQQLKDRIKRMDDEGTAYCPKCKSTSLSAHKKGFGIGKAVLGATIAPIGLIAGNINAKKVRVTCLKCGHQFWAGKK